MVDEQGVLRNRRASERLAVPGTWDVVLVTNLDCTPDIAELEPAVDDHRRHATISDVSVGGAAIEQALPKPAGLYVGATAYLGIKPTPTLARRWLWAEIVNMRINDARTINIGLRWTDRSENRETIEILARFIDKRLHPSHT